jgi:CRISPR-associated protein Csb3
MSTTPQPSIRVKVDLTNPGQFFACCGLLELADRLWPGAEGWFEFTNHSFCLHVPTKRAIEAPRILLQSLIDCDLTNTMTVAHVQRHSELTPLLKETRKKVKETEGKPKTVLKKRLKELEDEKKALDKLRREKPIVFHSPFNLQVDWFLDGYSGGSKFKAWAGQQSVIDITIAMHKSITNGKWHNLGCDKWLHYPSDDSSVPFNFDADLGPQSSSLDVGYSLDALQISTRIRPLIEIGAFIGLQRFRPLQVGGENLYRYRAWRQPLTVQVASIAACTFLPLPGAIDYKFRLLYRTKYLKSFLPATIIGALS